MARYSDDINWMLNFSILISLRTVEHGVNLRQNIVSQMSLAQFRIIFDCFHLMVAQLIAEKITENVCIFTSFGG